MTSPTIAQDAIVAAVLATLRAASSLAGVNVLEDIETDGLPEAFTQAVVVGLARSSLQEITLSGAPLDWVTLVRVDCIARDDKRSPSTGRPSMALVNTVHAALMADPSLGNLVQTLDLTALQPDVERYDTRLGCLAAVYQCRHRTAWNDLTPPTYA